MCNGICLLMVTLAATVIPASGQQGVPEATPANMAVQSSSSTPDFSGIWPSWEPSLVHTAGVGSRSGDESVADERYWREATTARWSVITRIRSCRPGPLTS